MQPMRCHDHNPIDVCLEELMVIMIGRYVRQDRKVGHPLGQIVGIHVGQSRNRRVRDFL